MIVFLVTFNCYEFAIWISFSYAFCFFTVYIFVEEGAEPASYYSSYEMAGGFVFFLE